MTKTSVVARESQHAQLPWTLDLARYTPDSPIFGFAIRADGKKPAICSAGIAEPHLLIPSETFASPSLMAQHFTPTEAEANAEFIVRACNSHTKLVEALRATLELLSETQRLRDWALAVSNPNVVADAEQALRLAQGEK